MSGRRQAQALSVAVDLLRIPSKVRMMRSAPLPAGIFLLLRLAAEDAEAQTEADNINKRAPDIHREAAIFFIEQILLASNSDSYRTLGLDKTATNVELRRHMVYLLKWLHPDRNSDPHKARLARRVLIAWNELKAAKNVNQNDVEPDENRRHKRLVRHTRRRPSVNSKARRVPPVSSPQHSNALRKKLRRRGWPL